MEIKINVPNYDKNQGIKYDWEFGFEIETKIENGEIIISANKAGLVSLARHFLMLSQEEILPDYHLHFDEFNSLENGSVGIIVQKQA